MEFCRGAEPADIIIKRSELHDKLRPPDHAKDAQRYEPSVFTWEMGAILSTNRLPYDLGRKFALLPAEKL